MRERSNGGGWIALWRSARDSKYHFTKERRAATRWEAREDLWYSAAWEPQHVMSRDQQITLERGQVLTSVLALAERWRWNRDRVRTFLGWLVSDSEITLQTDTRRTIITICDFDKWRGVPPTDHATNTTAKRHVEEESGSEISPDLFASERVLATPTHGRSKRPRVQLVETPGFLAWYELYPRPVKRRDACKAWRQVEAEKHPDLDGGTMRWVDYWRQNETPLDKIPYPATFLRALQWRDDPWKRNGAPKPDKPARRFAPGEVVYGKSIIRKLTQEEADKL